MTSYIHQTDIADAFRHCGIGRGDVLMLHSDAMVLAQLPPMCAEERYNTFFSALDGVLGPEGTLVLPTFTYSFAKSQAFSVEETPSSVGALTEHFRRMPGVLRSRDPIFSMAARGRLAEVFASVPIEDCFGRRSAFGLLHDNDASIACLGCKFEFTFIHYVEQMTGVNYRYFKTFNGILEDKTGRRTAEVRYYVRDLGRRTECSFIRLRARLEERGLLKVRQLGRASLAALKCRDAFREAQALLEQQPNALIAEGA